MGLGNPGPDYAGTRHNAGFILADAVADRWHFPPFQRPWFRRARVCEGTVGVERVTVVKPQTYMNRSGTALGPLVKNPTFDPSTDLLVLVDEVALPLGTFRLRARGSAGGHNGLKSIAGRLQSEDYARLRIGVGPRPEEGDQSDFLLSDFEDAERKVIDELLPIMTEAVECWVRDGIETAMNRFNRKGTQRE
ncbi:MAG: aminoacyl-tRNA hydrolase [Gemmatimonadetes bacterium]|nr:aminoacyl-tRNA hydrolase [Gemmatimonadota bacterium]